MPRKKPDPNVPEATPAAVEAPAVKKTPRKKSAAPAAAHAAPAVKPKRTAKPKNPPVVAANPVPAAAEPVYDPTEQITRLAHAIYEARQRRGEVWGTPEGDWAYAEVLFQDGVTNLE